MAEALVTKELLLSVGIELEQLGGRLRQQLAAGPSAAEPPVFQLGPQASASSACTPPMFFMRSRWNREPLVPRQQVKESESCTYVPLP